MRLAWSPIRTRTFPSGQLVSLPEICSSCCPTPPQRPSMRTSSTAPLSPSLVHPLFSSSFFPSSSLLLLSATWSCSGAELASKVEAVVGGVPPFTLWSIREVGGRSKVLWSSHYSNTWAGVVKGEEQAKGMDRKRYKNRSFHHPGAAEVFTSSEEKVRWA